MKRPGRLAMAERFEAAIKEWEARLCGAGHRPARTDGPYGEEVSISEGEDGMSVCLACGHKWGLFHHSYEELITKMPKLVVAPCLGAPSEALEPVPEKPLIDWEEPVYWDKTGKRVGDIQYYPMTMVWRVCIIKGGATFDVNGLDHLDHLGVDIKGMNHWQIDVDQYGYAIKDPSVKVVRN